MKGVTICQLFTNGIREYLSFLLYFFLCFALPVYYYYLEMN